MVKTEVEDSIYIIDRFLKDSRNVKLLINKIKSINDNELINELKNFILKKKEKQDELSVIYKTRYQYVEDLLNFKLK